MGKNIRHIIILILVLFLFTGCSTMGEKIKYYDENRKDSSPPAQEKVLSVDPDPRPEGKLSQFILNIGIRLFSPGS